MRRTEAGFSRVHMTKHANVDVENALAAGSCGLLIAHFACSGPVPREPPKYYIRIRAMITFSNLKAGHSSLEAQEHIKIGVARTEFRVDRVIIRSKDDSSLKELAEHTPMWQHETHQFPAEVATTFWRPLQHELFSPS